MEWTLQTASAGDEFMQAAEQLFSDQDLAGRRRSLHNPLAWRPPTDLCETEEAFVAHVEIAGVKEGCLSVSYADRTLTVTGIREYSGHRGAYHQMEIRFGEFRTQVRLPVSVDEDKIEASYSDGFLTVLMPKRGIHRVPVVAGIPPSRSED
jgi:HSP20 family molecular chaperone IbpA